MTTLPTASNPMKADVPDRTVRYRREIIVDGIRRYVWTLNAPEHGPNRATRRAAGERRGVFA